MAEKTKAATEEEQRGSLFARFILFWRQVIDELKKVVYPTSNELWTYFTVVIVFVLILMAFVGLVDLGSSAMTDLIFGK